MKIKHPTLPVEITVPDSQADGWLHQGWLPAAETTATAYIVGERGPELFIPLSDEQETQDDDES